jgi:hypothetical protein
MVRGTRNRASLALVYTAAVFGLAACGGGSSAKVGDCSNYSPASSQVGSSGSSTTKGNKVVSCSSADAHSKLVKKIANIQVICFDGDAITIDGTSFCAAAKK